MKNASDSMTRLDLRSAARAAWRYAGALAIVAAASLAADIFSRLTGTSRLTSIFLSSVLLVAFYIGPGPAYLAVAAALVAHLYMVDPPYKFSLGSIEEVNSLLLFMAASVLICILSGWVRAERAGARARAKTSAALLAATRELSATDDEQVIRARLTHWLHLLAGEPAVVKDTTDRIAASPPGQAGPADWSLTAETGDHAPAGRVVETQHHGGWSFRPLAAGEQHYGIAAWRSPDRDIDADDKTAIELLIDTGAAAIARSRLATAKTDAEARARTEDLRSALLSSVSHDLRTPLAAIMGAAGSLNRFADAFDVETRKDLASTIEEEARRLDTFVSNLLQMTRLQSGSVLLKRVGFNLVETVDHVLERRLGANFGRVELLAGADLPEALGDPVLFEQAFGNVIDNALRYAGHGAPIRVCVARGDTGLRVTVEDRGPGVPPHDLERIFEKFFRSSAAPEGLGGTGLGLAIARGLIEGMGGTVAARPTCGGGLTVEIALPEAAS